MENFVRISSSKDTIFVRDSATGGLNHTLEMSCTTDVLFSSWTTAKTFLVHLSQFEKLSLNTPLATTFFSIYLSNFKVKIYMTMKKYLLLLSVLLACISAVLGSTNVREQELVGHLVRQHRKLNGHGGSGSGDHTMAPTDGSGKGKGGSYSSSKKSKSSSSGSHSSSSKKSGKKGKGGKKSGHMPSAPTPSGSKDGTPRPPAMTPSKSNECA